MIDINKIPNISIIVAVAANNAIGKDNDLIWHISDDLKHFKAITSGHPVIMGRNTWNSLPKRPLPKRRNIVITHDVSFCDNGAEVAHSVAEALAMVSMEEESFVVGGAAVYGQFMPFANRLYVTHVLKDFDADTFFPVIDESVFCKVSESDVFTDEQSGLSYCFANYCRRMSDGRLP